MKLLIKFPSRGRPDKFKYALYNYISKCKNKKDTSFLFTFDEDDTTMNNESMKEEIAELCGSMEHYIVYGTSENKIHAINRDLKSFWNWKILLLASDDMIPVVKGYDEIIREKMINHYIDTDGVLWFNDGYAGDRLNTLVCMGKTYYLRFNYIYNPIYKSFFCDNEFMDTANTLRKQTYFHQTIIQHQHPANTADVQEDELYKQNNKYWNADARTYYHRKQYNCTLSVLICSLAERKSSLDNLLTALNSSIKRSTLNVEVLTNIDNREKSVGQKRNELVAQAQGKYCCFIDDDDQIDPNYFAEIQKALNAFEETDSLSLTGLYYKDGIEQKRFYHNMKFKQYAEDENGYYRPPNHLNVILTGFVKQIGFPKQNHGEDTDFAMRLCKENLIQREVCLQKPLYFYYFISDKQKQTPS
jgi:hypothetical protein